MSNPYDDDLSRFAVTFMRSVIAWNNAEGTARGLLVDMGGAGIGLRIAVEHLGSISLKDALNTLCDLLNDKENAPSSAELAEHVSHFVEGMDTLRGYRNFYVHALRYTGKAPDDPKTFQGFLRSVEAKGKYAYIEQHITTTDLESFMAHAHELEEYGRAISDTIPRKGLASALYPKEARQLASLEKPTWPERLKKHRSYLSTR